MDFSPLRPLGWKPFFQQQLSVDEFEAVAADTLCVARVSQVQRSELRALCGTDEVRVAFTRVARWSELVTVGDWIVVRRNAGQLYLERVLERHNGLRRITAGEQVAEQWIGANLDFAFTVMACDAGFSLNRLERYLAVALDGGVPPVVVLTRADTVDDPEAWLDQVQVDCPKHVLDARDPQAVDALAAYIQPGRTVAFIGSSGVGKSTLINSLYGADVMATGAVRAGDARGRHTTTHRELLVLPAGGLVIDTPGMRELALPDGDEGLHSLFDDVEVLAQQCRFRDCAHADEPGCRIQAALASGELDARRWENYLKMLREQAGHGRELQARHITNEQRRSHTRHVREVVRDKQHLRNSSLDDD